MAHRLAQIYWQFDTALPRDRVVTTCHFSVSAGFVVGVDDQSMANDLAELVDTYTGAVTEFGVKVYDGASDATGPPEATSIKNLGTIAESQGPREVALCLSFHDGQNAPRHRGRMYWPSACLGTVNTKRPGTAQMNQLLAFGGGLADIGGANVDWCVYSRTDDELRSVEYAWVDNEWDTQRSRGLTADNRVSSVLSE